MSTNSPKIPAAHEALCQLLEKRFEENRHRHPSLEWKEVILRLSRATEQQWASLGEMETTGGAPDIVVLPGFKAPFVFADFCAESPAGRRSLCYDQQALHARKQNKPAGSAQQWATDMGVKLLTETQYRYLQDLEPFDLKTSSWVDTPEEIRKLGGAIFCDRRYNTVFTYHNGAESYYAARGFRALLEI